MDEHARISRFFAPLTAGEPGSYQLSDDAAVLLPPETPFVITTDSVIEGTHVMLKATATQIAQKLVRRNLSDLAAMGAKPWRYTLNIHTPPRTPESWFAEFVRALGEEQRKAGMVLVGGDTTSGGTLVHTTLTCFGLVKSTGLRRNGARVGDDIYVSGTIGDGALGLPLLLGHLEASPEATAFLTDRYHLPQPRLTLGQNLCGLATAALDCSDGLLQDVHRLCEAAGLGARLNRDAVPLSPAARSLMETDGFWTTVLTGGDDYELIFTAAPAAAPQLRELSLRLQLPITKIGVVEEGKEVVVTDGGEADVTPVNAGWEYS